DLSLACDDARRAERRVALKSFPSGVKDCAVHPPGSKDVFKFLQRDPEDLIRRPQEARPDEPCRFLKDRPFREVEDPDDVVLGMFPESDTGTVDVDEPPHHMCLEKAAPRRPEAFEQAGRGPLRLRFAVLKVAAVLPGSSAAKVSFDGGNELR